MLQKYDPRNHDIKVYVNGQLVHRDEARVSVFDSVVQGGDAVWEGLRVYDGKVFCLDRHLDRLFDSAHAMTFEDIPTRKEVRQALFDTLNANGMRNDTHIRLTLTRGEKITSGMDPRLNQNGCSLIVLAEWKPPVYDNERGISVITSTIQRNSPRHLDSKIGHRRRPLSHHQHFIKRRGLHQVRGHQRIHRAGKRHHRKVIEQDEGHSFAFLIVLCAFITMDVGHILVF